MNFCNQSSKRSPKQQTFGMGKTYEKEIDLEAMATEVCELLERAAVEDKMKAVRGQMSQPEANQNPTDSGVGTVVKSIVEQMNLMRLEGLLIGAQRMVILDGCNILHKIGEGKIFDIGPLETGRKNARSILFLVHDLLLMGFEVMVFVNKYHMNKKNTQNVHIFELFEKLELLVVCDDQIDDDAVILQMAQDYGGFVISNDRYSQPWYDRFNDVRQRVIQIHYNTRAQEIDTTAYFSSNGRFVSNISITFMAAFEKFKEIAFCPKSDPKYGTVKDRCDVVVARNYVKKMIKECDVLEEFTRLCFCSCFFYRIKQEKLNVRIESPAYFDFYTEDLPSKFDEFYQMSLRPTNFRFGVVAKQPGQ